MPQRQPDHVVIINDRSAQVGGASNLAILSAKLLEERGLKVTFFAGDTPAAEKPAHTTINLCSPPLVQQGKFEAFTNGLYNGEAYQRLQRFIAANDTPNTVYHLHGWSKILSPSIFRALERVRARTILHAHDYFLACPNGGFSNYRTHSVCHLQPMSLRCLTTQCDKRGYHQKIWRSARHMLREHFYSLRQKPGNIVTVHEAMRNFLMSSRIDVENIETIRNPVEPFLKEPIKPWTQANFFFVGRLEPEKGFEEAAKAARLANIMLHIIGDGDGRALIKTEYPEVVIHGWQTREGIRSLVRDARAIVVSSRVPEPFGLAALEAVSSGIPVILPDSALLADEITALGCGLAFRSGNTNALAEALRQVAADNTLVLHMSADCLRHASALSHTATSWCEALLELYERILQRANQDACARSVGSPVNSRIESDIRAITKGDRSPANRITHGTSQTGYRD